MSFDHGVLVVPRKGFTVEYPILSPVHSVDLRSPLRGNKRIYNLNLEVHETMGQQTRTFRDPDWYMSLVQKVEFRALTRAQIDALRLLYEDAAGDLVRIHDHENRIWSAVFDEPKILKSQVGRGCQYITELSFLAVFSQGVYGVGGGGSASGSNGQVSVVGIGDGDLSGATHELLAPTGHFLITAGGDSIVQA